MQIMDMNTAAFEMAVKEEKKTVLVEFWAPWCVYGRRIGPAFEQIAQQWQDRLSAARVNIDQESALAEAYQVEIVPTLLLMRDGEAVASLTAPQTKAQIDEFLKENL